MAAESHDLEELIARVARRDRRAFARLYEAVSAKLFGIVLRIVRDRTLADDVLQDVFLRIWNNADRYDPANGRPVTWMAAVARNAAIDAARREGARARHTADVDDDGLAAIADDRAAGIHPAEREAMRVCLDRIEEDHRDCVILAYRDGYSREELAERYGRPVGTIKTWLHRALARLKECLDGQ